MTTIFEAACARAHEGMEIAAVAARDPQRPAIFSEQGSLTFDQLNRRVNQLANLLRSAGIGEGDPVALLCSNRPEFIVIRFACHRLGVRLTPVNWHLSPEEIAYVVEDSDALALFADIRCEGGAQLALKEADKLRVKVSIGGLIRGFDDWNGSLYDQGEADIKNPSLGSMMLYTSGTTGRPKGVLRAQPDPQKAADMQALLSAVFQFQPDTGEDLALVTGPLYHAGPFNLCMTTPLTSGIGTVVMDKWTPEETLALIKQYKITHTFMVPTMMQRLMELSDEARGRANTSSLRFVIHGAAPCAVETKQAIMDWMGPIFWEMFAGTEGPGTIVSPQEWLQKPGTVGKPGPDQLRILNEEGQQCPSGESGQVFIMNPPDSKFSYYKDQEKTRSSVKEGYFTAGDMGYLDEDGYLFLTGRSAEVIISGGVNIYPQEIDNVLARHPAVADVACVGVPNDDLGEEVKAIVSLVPGAQASESLAAELMAFCEGQLAKQRHPRSVDFVTELPRSEAGKVQRRALREQFWQGRDSTI